MIIDERDVRYETFSGHGAGGQLRNRKLKCVRAIHEPTGVRAVATSERSLQQNMKAALQALDEKIRELIRENRQLKANLDRLSKARNGFGAKYVRTYRMVPPANVLDHATGIESGLSVLDGKIDHIIRARLKAHEKTR